MKINKLFISAIAAMSLITTSCSDNNKNGEDSNLTKQEKAILANYVDDIVVSNYAQLATDGKNLLTAVKAIQSSADADKSTLISNAATAWKNARITWERTEAYLFGPVDKAGIDPGIDSWPLVLPDLQESIQKWDAKNDNYESLKGDGGDLKGFHSIEYMLFANGKPKTKTVATFDSQYAISQGNLSDEEFENKLESYTVAVAEELYRCVLQLEAEWNLVGLSSEKSADLTAFGSNITLNTPGGNYGEIFKTPSINNTHYQSFAKSLEEVFVGAIGIADEVANVKISDPINAEIKEGNGLLEVESWFSYNSVEDFTNNVRGIKEAYFGKLAKNNTVEFDTDVNPHANSVGAYIAKIDKTINDKAVAALNNAIAKVAAMPKPFRDNLSWNTANTAAKEAVAAVQDALEAAQVAK